MAVQNRRMLVTANPKNDYAFKAVFGSTRHTRVLIHLLNAVLGPFGLHVQSVTIVNPLSEFQTLDDKKLVLDVKAIDDLKRLYNVEMQMVPQHSFPGRLLYYWSNSYSSQLKEGEPYDRLRPVISICFLDGVLFPERLDYHLRFQLLETTARFPFTEDFDLHVFQLPYFAKAADELAGDLDLWLYVLNNAIGLDLDGLPERLRVAEVEEALEVWAMLTQDRKQRELYESREKARRDAEDWQRAIAKWQRAAEDAQRAAEDAQRAAEDAQRAAEDAQREAEDSKRAAEQAKERGRDQGLWIGQIRLCEEMLHRQPRAEADLAAMPADALRQLAEEFRAELARAAGE